MKNNSRRQKVRMEYLRTAVFPSHRGYSSLLLQVRQSVVSWNNSLNIYYKCKKIGNEPISRICCIRPSKLKADKGEIAQNLYMQRSIPLYPPFCIKPANDHLSFSDSMCHLSEKYLLQIHLEFMSANSFNFRISNFVGRVGLNLFRYYTKK